MIVTENIKTKKSLKKENSTSMDFIKLVEAKFLKNTPENPRTQVEIGDIIRIGYLIPEGEKDRTQYYEGVVIAKQNRGLGQSFTIRRSVQGVGVEQIFLFHSPKIVSITKKQSSKVRRAKLYYLRELSGKATKLKVKL
jgi:large subunit ribosomal protein L19